MATRFHVGTRGPAACSAQKGNCPFGGESGSENHFSSLSAAAEAFEDSMGGSLSTPLSKDAVGFDDYDAIPALMVEAAGENTPRGRMNQLAKHDDPAVRRVVATSSKASVSLLRRLAEDSDEETRAYAAGNENNSEENLSKLMEDKSSMVVAAAAANPKTPRAAIEKADVEGSLSVAMSVAANNSGNVSVRMFKKLSKLDDNEVQDRLASNSAAPEVVVTNAIVGARQANSLMEFHPNPPASAVEAAWRVHTTDGRVPDVDLYLATDSTPQSVLDAIHADPRYSYAA